MTPTKPSVLFVCVKNGGKSQMAAGLMRSIAGESVDVDSAGTKPGDAVNPLSAAALLEVGGDITGEVPKAITARRDGPSRRRGDHPGPGRHSPAGAGDPIR